MENDQLDHLILWVIPGSSTGVCMVFVKRQLAVLQAAGIQIDVFYIHPWKSLSVLINEIKGLRKAIRDLKPDLIHAQYGTMTGFVCAFFTTKPLIITYRGTDLNPASDTNPLRLALGHFLSQLSALRAVKIICVSREVKGRLWWLKKRAEIIPSPVDIDRFIPISKENARKAIGWNMKDRVVLLNHGNNPVEKGLHIAEEAVRIAEASLGPIRFVILDGNVPPDDIPFYLNASDCLLVASDWEGSPNIVKEAMACNLPVVSSRVGDVEERFNGVYPFKVTDRQADKLGEALAEVLSLNRRSNGREKVMELSQENIMRRLSNLYMEVFKKISRSREI